VRHPQIFISCLVTRDSSMSVVNLLVHSLRMVQVFLLLIHHLPIRLHACNHVQLVIISDFRFLVRSCELLVFVVLHELILGCCVISSICMGCCCVVLECCWHLLLVGERSEGRLYL
jgi:hypothetical protein